MTSPEESSGITYAVDHTRVEVALAVLRRETRVTRKFHRLFVGVGLVFAGWFAASALLAVIHRPGPASGELTSAGETAAVLLLLVGVLSGLLLGLGFLSDLAMPAVHWWFSRRLDKLGLGRLAVSAPLTIGGGVLRALAAILGVFSTMLLYVQGASATLAVLTGRGEFSFQEGPVLALITFALAAWPFARRWHGNGRLLRRLDEVADRMTSRLAQASSDAVEVELGDLNLMARAEAKQIEFERREALQRSSRDPGSREYALRISRTVLQDTMALDPAARILVQDQIEKLARDRKPGGAAWNDKEQVWRLAVPGTQLEVGYGVDDQRREVELVWVAGPGTVRRAGRPLSSHA